MNSLHPPTVLLFTALLADRRDLDHRLRSSIVTYTRPIDPTSHDEVIGTLADAFRAVGLTLSLRRRPTREAVCRAVAQADLWMRQGVFVVSQSLCRAPAVELHDLPPVWFAWGKRSILEIPAAAVLNSRKPRHAKPDDEWIRIVKTLVHSAQQRGFSLISSYGTLSYALTSFLAKSSPVIIACDGILPFMSSLEEQNTFLAKYADLFNTENTLFLSVTPPGRVPEKAVRWTERDHLAAASASLLLAAEIRPGGHMERILRIAADRGVPVETLPPMLPPCSRLQQSKENSETVKPIKKEKPPHVSNFISTCAAKTKILSAEDFAEKGSYLVHYTRSCPGLWPDETIAQYCRALLEAHQGAAHNAFDTLWKILDQGVIRASRRLTRGPAAVVCFTELLPRELKRLTVWRTGLLRWSFEPYGVALRKQSLFQMGARPVIYAVETAFQDLAPDLTHLFQPLKKRGPLWAQEKEWRIIGDVMLQTIDPGDIFVIVPTQEEAELLVNRFGYSVTLADVDTKISERREI